MPYEFTDDARKLLVLAKEEGRRHGWLGTEHLLLALLRHSESPASAMLAELGAEPEALRGEVDRLNATNATGLSPGKAPFTPRAKKAIAIAHDQAGKGEITPEHVLLGILLDEGGNFARELLERRGIDVARVRDELQSSRPGDG